MPSITLIQTVLLLCASNTFMTCAWYGHLKYLHDSSAVDRHPHRVGHRLFRILLSSARQPDRLSAP